MQPYLGVSLQDQRVIPAADESQFQALISVPLDNSQRLDRPESAESHDLAPAYVQANVRVPGEGVEGEHNLVIAAAQPEGL